MINPYKNILIIIKKLIDIKELFYYLVVLLCCCFVVGLSFLMISEKCNHELFLN